MIQFQHGQYTLSLLKIQILFQNKSQADETQAKIKKEKYIIQLVDFNHRMSILEPYVSRTRFFLYG